MTCTRQWNAAPWGWLVAGLLACGDDAGRDAPRGVDAAVSADAAPLAAGDAPLATADAPFAIADAPLSTFDAALRADGANGATCGCGDYAAPLAAGDLAAGLGAEISGVAASRRHVGILYVHGDDPVAGKTTVFAIDETAALVATYVLAGAAGDNLEDIAVGRCGATTCVFVGNIGDNGLDKAERQVHVFEEPPLVSATITPTTLRYAYPEGAHYDAESLVVDPAGDVFVLTKQAMRTQIFRIPAASGRPTAVLAGELTLPDNGVATAADLALCGTRLLVRTYGHLYEWRAAAASWASFEAATPATIAVAVEPQGEAVGYLLTGGFATISERSTPPLNIARCR